MAEVMFERLFLSAEVTDQQQEHGWQRASEDILSVVAKTTAFEFSHVPPAVELCTHTEQPSKSLTQTSSFLYGAYPIA